MFNWKKKEKKNKYLKKNLREVTVKFCVVETIENIFPIYLNEFVEKGNYDAFKDELISKEFIDVNQVIKILEVRIEASNLTKQQQERTARFSALLVSAIVALYILNLSSSASIIKDVNLITISIIAILGIVITIIGINYKVNPYDMRPLYYKHCIEILEEKKVMEAEEQLKKKSILNSLVELD